MIYVLALAILFLGAALVAVLQMASDERSRWTQERQTLLNRIQAPDRPSALGVNPYQNVVPLVPEDWGELNKVGTIIPGENET